MTIQHCPIYSLKKVYQSSEMRVHSSNEAVLFIRNEQKVTQYICFEFDLDIPLAPSAPLIIGFQKGQVGQMQRHSEKLYCFQPQIYLKDHLGSLIALYIIKEFQQNENGDISYTKRLATALMSHLLKLKRKHLSFLEHCDSSLTHHNLRKIDDYIHKYMDQPISVSDLAEITGFSDAYFSKLFKNATGKSPYKYLTHCRMEKARDLLLGTDEPIIQVSFAVGIDNHSQFCQIFKRYYGFSPSEMRDLRKE